MPWSHSAAGLSRHLLQLRKQFVQIVRYVHGTTPANFDAEANTVHALMLRHFLPKGTRQFASSVPLPAVGFQVVNPV